jgi:two-component system, response regulator
MTRSFDVLVVDDRSVDADATVFAVRRAAPHAKVLRLKSGIEALRYLFSVDDFARRSGAMPSLVFLDMEMPVTSGLCILDVIRAHPATRDIRVVMLGSDSDPDASWQKRFTADAYIARPLDFEDYCSVIEAMLRLWLPRSVQTQLRFDAASARPSACCERYQ